MEMFVLSLNIVLATLAAGTMGYAIQRGATCAVAAVDEVVNKGSGKRLWAMLEASLWVTLGLSLAQRLHWLDALPSGHALTPWTVLGAALLGVGAWVNKACVFGAVARLGSGEWAYAASPVGYWVGCITVTQLFTVPAMPKLPSNTLMSIAASGALWPLLALMVWRFYGVFRRNRLSDLPKALGTARTALWKPHGATIIIGFAFLATILLVGTWAYTDVLAQLAQGMRKSLAVGGLMAVALLSGAMWGGYTAGRMRWSPVSVEMLCRCFVGGVLMAWGSLLIPGSNDGLILIGMPLLWPYAWVGFFIMCVTVGVAQMSQARWLARA